LDFKIPGRVTGGAALLRPVRFTRAERASISGSPSSYDIRVVASRVARAVSSSDADVARRRIRVARPPRAVRRAGRRAGATPGASRTLAVAMRRAW
jgi:hypothetical protein